ncbi:MAG TPA: hypothetical protein VFO34_17350 [Candidatus Acidoferrales bacterium]|nr:hypothetical protein [Candidatus Acidoferrales bacterium]
MDKIRVGQSQIESAIGIMVEARGLKLESPLTWHEDAENHTFLIQARISGRDCRWRLIREAVENYIGDLNVRHSVDFILQAYFIPH